MYKQNTLKFYGFVALLSLFLMFTTQSSVFAQEVTVKGKVTNAATNEPIPGVNINVKGTTNGSITDIDGNFSLTINTPTATLVVSSVGYLTSEVMFNGQATLDVALNEEASKIDEVVVTGYGTQKKMSLTGAIATVNNAEINTNPTANTVARLQGRVAGVTITTDNAPGGDATVRVRGFGSINNNDPLYVIDGVPTTGGLSKINPNDIETMSVLKDASSSAIYGSRAANGVILITTKRGKSGKSKLSFDFRTGIQKNANKLDLLNTKEYGELYWLEYKNAGLTVGGTGWGNGQYGYGAQPVIPDYIIPQGITGTIDESTYSYPSPYNGITKANKVGTDWQDEIYRVAKIQEYNLAVSGGGDKSNYAISAGYLDQRGVVNYTGFKRYSVRLNSDVKLTDWLLIGESVGTTYIDRQNAFYNNDEGNAVSQTYRMQPIIPVYDIKGNFAGTKANTTGNGANPVAVLYRDQNDYSRELRVLANTYAQINFLKDFSFKTLVGADFNSVKGLNRTLMNPEFSESISANTLSQNFDGGLQYNWANTLNYTKSFGDHNLNILVGSEAVNNSYEYATASRSTFAFDDTDYMVLNTGEKDKDNSGYIDAWATFSYFGRLNYNYKSKYLFEAVVRRDGSSRFSKDNRWGTFPAFSLGWRISEESFMKNLSWINNLKLRAGWGKLGNDNVGNYNTYSTYRYDPAISAYNISGSGTSAGFYKYKLGNLDAKWESSVTTNVGVDLVVFTGLEMNLDIYSRVTTDMLYPDSRPSTWGQLELPSVNIGEMKNTGFDLLLTYHGNVGKDLKFNITGNLSHYKNEVVKLNNNPDEIVYGDALRQETYTASQAGHPISSFYGYQVEGIFNTAAEVTAWPKYNPDINGVDVYSKPGVFKYKDVNNDGKITSADRTFIGTPHPDFTYGLNLNAEYKGFDLSMFFQGSQGNQLVNYVNRWTLFNNFSGNRSTQRLYESWTAERYADGSTITMPIALRDDANMQKASSFFVEDGSYFRMKDIQIGYTLPSKIASRMKIDRLRVYVQGSNLFTVTKYSGLDPEIRNSDNNNRHLGVDEGIYPTSRLFIFGLNFNL